MDDDYYNNERTLSVLFYISSGVKYDHVYYINWTMIQRCLVSSLLDFVIQDITSGHGWTMIQRSLVSSLLDYVIYDVTSGHDRLCPKFRSGSRNYEVSEQPNARPPHIPDVSITSRTTGSCETNMPRFRERMISTRFHGSVTIMTYFRFREPDVVVICCKYALFINMCTESIHSVHHWISVTLVHRTILNFQPFYYLTVSDGACIYMCMP